MKSRIVGDFPVSFDPPDGLLERLVKYKHIAPTNSSVSAIAATGVHRAGDSTNFGLVSHKEVHCLLATGEGDEVPQGIGQLRREGVETKRFGNVEACGFGGIDVRKGRKSGHGLTDAFPAKSSLIAIVVGWVNAFGYALNAGDVLDGTAEG